MRVLILHNPGAGGGNCNAGMLIAAFEAEGHAVDYRSTKAAPDWTEAAGQAEVVVVAGGDGTIAKVVRVLGDNWPLLAILPLGTANNIARALGVWANAAAVAAGLASWPDRGFNVGMVDGPWERRLFLEGVGVGAFADLVAEGNARDVEGEEKREFGDAAPARILREAAPRDWRATADGAPLPPDLLLIEMLNVPIAGPGLRLVRGRGRTGDGMLDVVTLRAEAREAMARWTEGDRERPPEAAERRTARRIEFEWAGGALRIDDDCPEHPGGKVRVAVTLADERLRVLVPPDGEG
jgi:diacylglycerol kinase (ATP)